MKLATKKRCRLYSLACSMIASTVLYFGSLSASGQEMVPDFSLLDVNMASTTFNQPVSPRDYLGQASGWYFGSAT